VGEETEGQQQFVHALGGFEIVEVVLAAGHRLGDKGQRGVAGDEVVDQWIQAAVAADSDTAGRWRVPRQPLVGGAAAEERKQLLQRLVHQINERIRQAERRGRRRGAQEDLPRAPDVGTVAVQRLQIPLLHCASVAGNALFGSARLGKLCAFLAVRNAEDSTGLPRDPAGFAETMQPDVGPPLVGEPFFR